MTTITTNTPRPFDARADQILATLRDNGQFKHLRMIESPMDASVRVRGYTGRQGGGGEPGGGWGPDGSHVLCFCSNNYLGLANHPEVVEAGIKGLRDFGAGTASVRFICGTSPPPHEVLEETIARYNGDRGGVQLRLLLERQRAVFPTPASRGT